MITSLLTTPMALAAAANFFWILLKALQQRNVAFGNLIPIVLVSYFLAASEIIMVYTIASTGIIWPLILAMGTSGALGCICAVKLHEYYLKRTHQDADIRNQVQPVRQGMGRTVSLRGRSASLSEVREHRD